MHTATVKQGHPRGNKSSEGSRRLLYDLSQPVNDYTKFSTTCIKFSETIIICEIMCEVVRGKHI